MRQSTIEFINRFIEKKMPPEVESIRVFGSEVYGTPTCFSDIDLAIVSSVPLSLEQKAEIDSLAIEASPLCEVQFVFVVLPLPEIYQGMDVRKNIFEKGIVIYDRKKLHGYCDRGL